jgi:uncharacterized membrane protein
MMRIPSFGCALFAVTLIGFGIWSLVTGELGAIWQPIPKGVPFQEALVYLCAAVALTSGAGLLLKRTAAPAARLLLGYLLVWFLLSKGPDLVQAPLSVGPWESAAESLGVIAAAWAIYARLAEASDRSLLGIAVGENGGRIVRILFGLTLIIFGVAHFAYLNLTAPLVPAWLPAHTFWAYATGAAYIAAGAAVLSGPLRGLAAWLATLQMGLFTLLVWAPRLIAGSKDPSDWSEAVLSWTLTIAGLVVAESRGGVSAPATRGASRRLKRRKR